MTNLAGTGTQPSRVAEKLEFALANPNPGDRYCAIAEYCRQPLVGICGWDKNE